MNLFKLKQKNADSDRSELELLSNADGSVQVAFGVHWFSVVSSEGKEFAVKMARQHQATHLIFRGKQAGYGFIDSKKNNFGPLTKIYPAAQVLARQNGKNSLYLIKIGDGEYWLAAIRNGEPTLVDQFILADNDSILVEEAQKVIEVAAHQDFAYEIYTNLDNHPFDSTKVIGCEDILISAESTDSYPLELLPKAATKIPTPVLLGILALVVVMGGQEAWKYKKQHDAAKLAADALFGSGQDDVGSVAWARALDTWERETAAPNANGLSLIRESLGTLPIRWNGWDLKTAVCNVGAVTALPVAAASTKANGNALQKTWNCSAIFERSKTGKFNREMTPVNPNGRSISFTPLNQMQMVWTVNDTANAIKGTELNTVAYHFVETVSKFQELSATFTDMGPIAFTPVAIKAPSKKDGTPYPADATIVPPQFATIKMMAPLRSIDKLSNSSLAIDWKSILITSKPFSNSSESTINQSVLNADVTGVLYAKTK